MLVPTSDGVGEHEHACPSPSNGATGAISPATSITSTTLIEGGLLKTVDVPGEDTDMNNGELDQTFTYWQEDTMALFHFSLYTLRPGHQGSDEMAAGNTNEAISEEPEEEEEEEAAADNDHEQDIQAQYRTAQSNSTATAMDALQQRVSALSLDPALAASHDAQQATDATLPSAGSPSTHTRSSPATGARVIIRELIRDTRTSGHGRPFELRIGRNFVAPALEVAVKSMVLGEQSRFMIRRESTEGFSQLERSLRLQENYGPSSRRSSLTSGLHQHGIARSRSNSIASCRDEHISCLHQLHQHHLRQRSLDPADTAVIQELESLPLEVHIHMLERRSPMSTNEAWWLWPAARRHAEAAVLRQAGNQLYDERDWLGATARYEMCITLLEPMPDDQRERAPRDDAIAADLPLVDADELRRVCLLNLAACALKLRQYARCIQHCDTVLVQYPGDAKAHYRRGTARIALGEDLSRAREDLEAAKSLMVSELRRRGRRMSNAMCVPLHSPGLQPRLYPPAFSRTTGFSLHAAGRHDSGISCSSAVPSDIAAAAAATANYNGASDDGGEVYSIYDTEVVGDDDDNKDGEKEGGDATGAKSSPTGIGIITTTPTPLRDTFQRRASDAASDDLDLEAADQSFEFSYAFHQLRAAERAEEFRARQLFDPNYRSTAS